jgi:hypothetical protein
MTTIFLFAFIAILVISFYGLHYRRNVRSSARGVSLILGLLFLAATVALLYGAISLGDKGAGVLFIPAMLTGFLAWLALMSFVESVKREDYFDLTVDDKIRYNELEIQRLQDSAEARILANQKQIDRFWTSREKRARLQRDNEHARGVLAQLPQMRENIRRRETYRHDES